MPSSPGESLQRRNFLPRHFWKIAVPALCLAALAAFVLSSFSYIGNHPSRSPVVKEIAALSAALENYKFDHGHYPSDPQTTELLSPHFAGDPESCIPSSGFLYKALSGSLDGSTVYYTFSPEEIKTSADGRVYIVDPWGNSLGYSTREAVHPESRGGYNPTCDLWSTSGEKVSGDKEKWITNWQNPGAN
jgi:hypothetical protein